jgi:S-DNA-T family DNA segregation ATPase FtsK/SpoIIIE
VAKKKKQQLTIRDPETLAVFGIVCLVFSILLIISNFVDHPALHYFRSLFGVGVIVMGIVLFLTALRLLGSERHYNSFRVVSLLFLFLLSFLGWIHLFADPLEAELLARNGQYGGIVGYMISEKMKELSVEVAFATLFLIMIFSLLSALNISLKQLAEWLAQLVDFILYIFKKIYAYLISIIKLIIKSKQKLDQLELNWINNTFSSKSANKAAVSTSNVSQDEKQESENVAIKMVSDISSQSDSNLNPINDLKISVNNRVIKHPHDTNTLKDNDIRDGSLSSHSDEPLDLTVRHYADWKLPPLELLDPLKPKQQESKAVIERKARAIIETLKSFNIEAKILGYTVGPTVTQFFIDPAAGIKFSKIANLSKDLALTLASPSDLRIELVPGKSYIGIDVPNDVRQSTQMIESIKPIYDQPAKYKLGLAVGIDTQGNPVCRDLASAPHMLIAGATGQGKSVLVNAFIVSLLMRKTPDELKFIMIDPKMVEMAPYEGIPHLLTSPITDMSKAANALKWAVNEMEERYKVLKDARVRNIEDYINLTGSLMPYIVIIIDEFSDLMMQYRQDVETSIIRLAQKSRAVGIHLIIATQRPTADIITGLIKSNVPTRVALAVASSVDSRVILDSTGAETLLGKGDLLIKTANDLKPVRVQGLYIDDKGENSEFYRILNFIKDQAPEVYYNDAILKSHSEESENTGPFESEDPLFRQAAEIVISAQKGSASLLQTKMKIGYARAARLIDELERAGIVGPQDGPRPREVLVSDLDAFFSSRNAESEVVE